MTQDDHEPQTPTMATTRHTTPDQTRARRLGAILRQWREERGLKRPEVVALMTTTPDGRISTDYLGKIEYGTRSLAGASVEVREAIRLALRVPAADWTRETGLFVPHDAPDPAPPSGPSARLPGVGGVPTVDDLPPGLEDAIRRYGEDYPALHDPTVQQQLALARFYTGRGPQTARDWLAYYLSIASWIGT